MKIIKEKLLLQSTSVKDKRVNEYSSSQVTLCEFVCYESTLTLYSENMKDAYKYL